MKTICVNIAYTSDGECRLGKDCICEANEKWLEEAPEQPSPTIEREAIKEAAKLTQPKIIELVDEMCGESLSPELYEKWEEVSAMLKNNRKAFNADQQGANDPPLCPICNGSGEGPADGTRCWSCKGSGVITSRKDNDF